MDNLQKKILIYMHNNKIEYGQYVALIRCAESDYSFNCCYEYGIYEGREYVVIFKGKSKGKYFGHYDVLCIRLLQEIPLCKGVNV